MKVQEGVVAGCAITWGKIMREVERNKRQSADAWAKLRALLPKPKPKPAHIVPLSVVPQLTGARPKVPHRIAGADIMPKYKEEKREEKGEKSPTLEEVVESWGEINPTLDQKSSMAMSPSILPPLPQRPQRQRPQREEQEQKVEEEQVVEEVPRVEEEQVVTPVKPPSLISLTTSPGFDFKLDWTIPRSVPAFAKRFG